MRSSCFNVCFVARVLKDGESTFLKIPLLGVFRVF